MALFSEFLGGTPRVPAFVPVDAQAEQQKAIAGNAAALPGAEALASNVNTFNQSQLDNQLNQLFGGQYGSIKNTITGNIQSELSGQLPQDVQDAVLRNSAVKSLYGGFGSSGMAANLSARDLGLTSLQLTQTGLNSAESWMGSAAKAPLFDVSQMFISPTAQVQFAQSERDAKFQHDYIQDQWDWYGSFGQQMNRFEDTAVQLASSMSSSMAGCWVARECFGKDNPKWKQFRLWLFLKAPDWFRKLYLENGERFAKWVHNKPWIKFIIRKWMEGKANVTI